jgi:hypothetical protein
MSRVPTASAEAATLPCSNPGNERRRRERLMLCLGAQIRPLYSEQEHFEDVTATLDFNRNGLSFLTVLRHYYIGMALIVTVPYCSAAPVSKEYDAQVVRIDSRSDGTQVVAVQFLY